MTTHHMFTAAEARELLEAATPGPWMYDWRGHEDGAPGDLWHTGGCGGPLTREADWDLAAQAPDLAQTVVQLHAEVERAASAERARIVALLTERAEATREHDGRESSVSLTYRQAAALIAALVTP
jgi:hypothetical protein